VKRALWPVLGLGGLVLLWHLAARRYSPEQFPGPAAVFLALRELAQDGTLWLHVKVSLLRFGLAYALAVLLALPLGLLLGWWSRGLQVLDPVLQVLRPISPIAWFPLAVLWFGVGNAPAVFIITLAAFFPLLLATVASVRNIPAIYLKVAANFGAPPSLVFRSVLLPASFPGIVVGLRLALGAAWIHLVAGEMLGAQSGLGFLIVDARNFLRTDLIIAGMLVIGLLGLALDRSVALAERRVRRAWGQP
jgi:NitT/TauT family transport system permease protein